MSTWRQRFVPLTFLCAGVLFLAVALLPFFTGSPINWLYLSVAAICVTLSAATWRRAADTKPSSEEPR